MREALSIKVVSLTLVDCRGLREQLGISKKRMGQAEESTGIEGAVCPSVSRDETVRLNTSLYVRDTK